MAPGQDATNRSGRLRLERLVRLLEPAKRGRGHTHRRLPGREAVPLFQPPGRLHHKIRDRPIEGRLTTLARAYSVAVAPVINT